MLMPSRRALTAAILLAGLSAAAHAQTQPPAGAWPNRVVRFTIPAAAGTAPDIMARTIGDRLAKMWGQPVIVDNKPGAGGVIGMAALKAAERNQHQLGFVQASALTKIGRASCRERVSLNV